MKPLQAEMEIGELKTEYCLFRSLEDCGERPSPLHTDKYN